jgi:hypothetical protein
MQSFLGNFLEDFEQLFLTDFRVFVFVNGSQQVVDLLFSRLSSCIHMSQGSIDEGGGLILV